MSIPFFIMVLIVWIYDPLNYFGNNNIIPQVQKNVVLDNYSGNDMIKQGEIKKIFFRLKRKDVNCWIIGDSRTAPISVNYIDSLSQEKWCNMGLPGCYTNSATSSFFWLVNHSYIKPKVVYWGHNFWYATSKDYFVEIDDYGETLLTYITSKRVWGFIQELCVLGKGENVSNNSKESQVDTYNIKNEWDDIVSRKQNEVLTKQIVVDSYVYTLIDSVSNYCKNHNIRLIHVYPPEYKELLAIINSDSTTNAEYQNYLNHLSQYEFYNFNQGKWIENKEDFVDPMHPKPHMYINIIDSIFSSRE